MPRTVLAAFDQLLTDLELTDDQQKIGAIRQTALRDFLKGRFKLAEDPVLVGSYSRRTIVRRDRDIDIMVSMDVSTYWKTYEQNSSGLVYQVREALNKQYGKSDVSTSGAAVVMQTSMFNVDVVPVFRRNGGGYLLADGAKRWKATNPPYHYDLMETRNKADPNLKPLVKLVKYWNIVNDARLESFHLEMAVEQMWRKGKIGPYPQALAQTLKVLPAYVQGPVSDPWDAGGRIDGYLTDDTRKRALQMASSDTTSSANAEALRAQGNERAAFEQWQVVFHKGFPAFG